MVSMDTKKAQLRKLMSMYDEDDLVDEIELELFRTAM